MRRAGILLPIFSLPGKYGIGCFSKNAFDFIDFLKESGQRYWQILPVGPTGYGDSPYQTFCSFAGNPYFISLETLIEEGLLDKKKVDKVYKDCSDDRIDYEMLYNTRFTVLHDAYESAKKKNYKRAKAYKSFEEDNAEWLTDYALFMSLKDEMGGISFTEWPEELRVRDEKALKQASKRLAEEISFYKFLQYKFYEQWEVVKKYANDKGIDIIGDLPIYVSPDSADAWAHPELFQLDKNARPKAVAGCPPDGFTPLGQLWGNPLYDWNYHNKTGYAWWISRIDKCRKLYDIIRIDHFRGFDEYYSVPAGDTDARGGHWVKGPGMKLFRAIKKSLGEIRIIAEDLGYTTDTVRKLVKDSSFPNMKILEFAFYRDENDDGEHEFLPCNHYANCVVYTGTHDNETLMGWLKGIEDDVYERMSDYLGYEPELKTVSKCKKKAAKCASQEVERTPEVIAEESKFVRSEEELHILADKMIRAAHGSVADYCILPVQDYLYLDNSARINAPSTLGNNWVWRIDKKDMNACLSGKIRKLTDIYDRLEA